MDNPPPPQHDHHHPTRTVRETGATSGSLGIDGDGDVSLQGEAGVGTPNVGVGANYNAEGDYEEGWGAGLDASCSAGPVTAGLTEDGFYGETGTFDTADGLLPGCSATVQGGYTW